VEHRDDDAARAGDEVHGSAHAGRELARDHPVGEPAELVDLQPAQHRHVEVAAADEAERHRAVDASGTRDGGDEAAAGIGQVGILHAFGRPHAQADDAVLGLQVDVHARWQVAGHLGRQANAEIDQRPGPDLLRDASRDQFLRVHLVHPVVLMRPGCRPGSRPARRGCRRDRA
jgi:hypothetical protein